MQHSLGCGSRCQQYVSGIAAEKESYVVAMFGAASFLAFLSARLTNTSKAFLVRIDVRSQRHRTVKSHAELLLRMLDTVYATIRVEVTSYFIIHIPILIRCFFLHSRPHRSEGPNDEPAVPTNGVNLDDRILVNRLEFAVGLKRTAGTGDIRGRTPCIGLSEPIESLALESSDTCTTESAGARRLRGQSGLASGSGIVERLDLCPALFGALEENGLAVVSCRDECLLGRKAE
jgi:hypothetical protein